MTQPLWTAEKCIECGTSVGSEDVIVINDEKNLCFCSENCLYVHFRSQIDSLEKEYTDKRGKQDISQDDILNYQDCLNELLEDPDEIWEDNETFEEIPLHHFFGEFIVEGETIYYVAAAYMTGEVPSFVFLHFPTNDVKLVEYFRRGRLIYERSQSEIEVDSAEEDALSEGDELARGLFQAMLTLRGDKDLPESEFPEYLRLRQDTIEEADEIWRNTDLQGNTLVNFIKDYTIDGFDYYYVVVTTEDVVSGRNHILFSFPTKDSTLMGRYRQGTSLSSGDSKPPESH